MIFYPIPIIFFVAFALFGIGAAKLLLDNIVIIILILVIVAVFLVCLARFPGQTMIVLGLCIAAILLIFAFTLAANYISNQNNLDNAHNSLIGQTLEGSNKRAFSNGSELKRTIVTFIDEDTAKLTQGLYEAEVARKGSSFETSFTLKELYKEGEFEYELNNHFLKGIVVRINGEDIKTCLDENGNVTSIDVYDTK